MKSINFQGVGIIKLLSFLLILILILNCTMAEAQCSMCRAVAESAQDENSIAKGLNSGILYLLAFPFILMGGIGIFFFRKTIFQKLKSFRKF